MFNFGREERRQNVLTFGRDITLWLAQDCANPAQKPMALAGFLVEHFGREGKCSFNRINILTELLMSPLFLRRGYHSRPLPWLGCFFPSCAGIGAPYGGCGPEPNAEFQPKRFPKEHYSRTMLKSLLAEARAKADRLAMRTSAASWLRYVLTC